MAGVLSLNGTFTYPIELLKTLTVDDSAFFKKSVIIGDGEVSDIGVTEGTLNKAIGQYSHASGKGSEANGMYSKADGEETVSNGTFSHASGRHSKSTHNYSFTWSGVQSKNIPYESNGEGTFNINPVDKTGNNKPENGLYIGKTTLPEHIKNYAIEYVNGNNNIFTRLNTFKSGIVSEIGDVVIKSGSFSTETNVESTFKGPIKVTTQDTNDESKLVANTEFVKLQTDKCLHLNGGTMSGDLMLNKDPEEDLQAATKKYVDDLRTIVTVDNSSQPNGSEIAKIVVNGNSSKIYSKKIVAGQNVSVQENDDGTVKINCNPNITLTGGTIKVPIGTIIPYCGNNAPGGFLYCDGRAISRTAYSELFNVIGGTFGAGDGSTTFNLPNLSDNRFLEGSNANGTYRNAGLPNIRGSFNGYEQGGFFQNFSGAFTDSYTYNEGNAEYHLGGGKTSKHFDFNAAHSSSVYSDSVTTVQPKSLTVKYYIKYTASTEEQYVLSVNDVKPNNLGNVSLKISKTYTPLIDWEFNNNTGIDPDTGLTFRRTVAITQGAFNPYGYEAYYSLPFKEDFTNYDEIIFVGAGNDHSSPDIQSFSIRADFLDMLLSRESYYNGTQYMDGVFVQGFYAPLIIGTYKSIRSWGKSTRRKLAYYSSGAWCSYIYEVYGVKERIVNGAI